jgi:hypothetical protein
VTDLVVSQVDVFFLSLACSFWRFMQAAFELAGKEKWYAAFLSLEGRMETF